MGICRKDFLSPKREKFLLQNRINEGLRAYGLQTPFSDFASLFVNFLDKMVDAKFMTLRIKLS